MFLEKSTLEQNGFDADLKKNASFDGQKLDTTHKRFQNVNRLKTSYEILLAQASRLVDLHFCLRFHFLTRTGLFVLTLDQKDNMGLLMPRSGQPKSKRSQEETRI